MHGMTYRELRKFLQEMVDERLDDTATVYDAELDQYIPVVTMEIVDDQQDVLDEGHAVIIINA